VALAGELVSTGELVKRVWPRKQRFEHLSIPEGSPERLPNFPDAPAASETLPGFAAVGWYALMAPPGTPEPIARQAGDDLRSILNRPDVRERLQEMGCYTRPMSPAELRAFVESEQKLWKPGDRADRHEGKITPKTCSVQCMRVPCRPAKLPDSERARGLAAGGRSSCVISVNAMAVLRAHNGCCIPSAVVAHVAFWHGG
jgi:hypothetical protein